MNDELPIFIYCLTRTYINNAQSEYHMVEDHLNFVLAELDESKVVTNAMSPILFICNGFELKDKDYNDKKTKEMKIMIIKKILLANLFNIKI